MADITYESHYRPRWFHPRLRWLVAKGLIWRMLVLAFLAWLPAVVVFRDALHRLTWTGTSVVDWFMLTFMPAYPEFSALVLLTLYTGIGGGETQMTVIALLLFHGRLLLVALIWLHHRKKRTCVILSLVAFAALQAALSAATSALMRALSF